MSDAHQLVEVQANDLQQLTQMIASYKEIQGEVEKLNEQYSSQLKEKKTRLKALETVILRIMKQYEIQNVNLSKSNSVLVRKTKTSKGTLNQKTLETSLKEILETEEKVKKALDCIEKNRGSKSKDVLTIESL
jgi:hypothetical protein